ncbi:o-succinylbenzoate--CoA ligase [Shewanella ulleungensis]|jgi:O-succinylbenzoic acid--CoA ligase|uniref:2-succinylbenzoate-CoA ligase n=1 Tax=Shewanella ulleungensis TaxID=2282699 RepID=A0ABQ2QRC7_9GAMM|nr:o-succinylbenzoate--CoA ligase [Shewanella ulleungensis]MCL1150755.1 o-succinylbenzoate--CoA ligase [Shewanella ulleungensis]GGP93852.1 2-succinylbenzoate-CoA ligase [Shewanella ulleungensis]
MMISPLHQTALTTPDAVAIEDGHDTYTYATLSAMVSNLTQSLQAQHIERGDIVACLSQNNLEMICLYWACIDAGWVFLPLSPRLSNQQINLLIDTYQIQWLWTDNPSRQIDIVLAHWLNLSLCIQTNSSQTATKVSPHIASNIILTSGSSGTPKAAMHCLLNHIASAQGSASYIPLRMNDTWLLSLPLFHIGGLAILHRCTLAGACIVLRNSAISLSEQLQHSNITHVSLVPTQALQILAQQPHALTHVKALLLGGGMIEPQLINTLNAHNIKAYTSYGMTEMSSQITTAKANLDGHHGRALPARQLKLVDGIIWVKGECLFMGYLTAQGIIRPVDEQGWFCTQDKGQLNEKGQLMILGRADNMFICGGENVHPEQIEAVLLSHPNVAQAIVFAISDPIFGHLPAAIIDYVDNNGAELIKDTAIKSINAQLSELIEQKLARFIRPRQYVNWPKQIVSSGIKAPRKLIIAAVQQQLA